MSLTSWLILVSILSEKKVGFLNQLILRNLSPANQRRWRSFTKQRRARVGMWVFFVLLFFSLTAELWSNHQPLVLIRDVPVADGATETQRRWFFPAIFNYPAESLGVFDSFTIDYKQMLVDDETAGKDTFALFPINKWDPFVQTSETLASPSGDHWLGTDNLGRDVVARLLYGVRISLAYGLMYWFFSFIIGIVIGAIQGFKGGSVDFATERVKELAEIVPFLSIVILINGLTRSGSFWVTLAVVVFFGWMGIAGQLRAQFLSLRRRDFCEAARALGADNSRIIFKHILPNALTPILTFTPFTISAGVAVLAVLDYLGFGLNPPTPSLGELLAQGRVYITNAPWLLLAPTVALATMLISINLIGESLRQAFDPKKG